MSSRASPPTSAQTRHCCVRDQKELTGLRELERRLREIKKQMDASVFFFQVEFFFSLKRTGHVQVAWTDFVTSLDQKDGDDGFGSRHAEWLGIIWVRSFSCRFIVASSTLQKVYLFRRNKKKKPKVATTESTTRFSDSVPVALYEYHPTNPLVR